MNELVENRAQNFKLHLKINMLTLTAYFVFVLLFSSKLYFFFLLDVFLLLLVCLFNGRQAAVELASGVHRGLLVDHAAGEADLHFREPARQLMVNNLLSIPGVSLDDRHIEDRYNLG